MNKPKFTPGPWLLSSDFPMHVFETSEDEDAICELYETESPAEWVANARLIARAPEMYTLLKQFCEGMSKCEDEYDKAGVAESMLLPMQEILNEIDTNE